MSTTSTRPSPETALRPSRERRHGSGPTGWLRRLGRLAILIGIVGVLALGGWWAGRQLWAEHLWRQAENAVEARDFAEGRRQLQRYLAIRPEDGDGHFLMARTCRRAQDFQGCLDHLAKCRSLRYDPRTIELEHLMMQAQSGDLRDSEARLLALLQDLHPQEVLILEALTRGYLQVHRLREAHIWAGRWFDRHPEDHHALLWRALSSELARQYGVAIADYRKVLQIEPDSPDARLRLANVLFLEGQFEEAAEHYQAYLQLVPEPSDALMRLAQCQRSLGNLPAAKASVDRHLAAYPDSPSGLLVRAQIDMDEEQPQAALERLRKAEKRAAEEPDVIHSLALVLRRLEKDEEAARYENRLREVRAKFDRLDEISRQILAKPNDLALRVEAANLLMAVGREREALRWLVSVQQMSPRYRPMLAAFADFYQRAGRRDMAEHYRRLAGPREPAPSKAATP